VCSAAKRTAWMPPWKSCAAPWPPRRRRDAVHTLGVFGVVGVFGPVDRWTGGPIVVHYSF
jgi:hypothetical protein